VTQRFGNGFAEERTMRRFGNAKGERKRRTASRCASTFV
jgi:hypothetical protein